MKIVKTVVAKNALMLFFLIAILFPLGKIFLFLFKADVRAILIHPQFFLALKNSLVVTTVSTIISVLLAFILSFCVMRTNIKHKTIISTLVTLPMLIPSISHGMGLIFLFGANGIITNFLKLNTTIYGFGGILIGSVMYSFPVAFLMIVDILKYEDYVPYEACAVLGISGWQKMKAVTLPYLAKPMISVFFTTFTMIVTDYGVPLVVGGKYLTLPVMMYQEVVGLLDFGKGSVIGVILLLPAVAAFIIDLMKRDNGSNTYTITPFRPKKNILRTAASYMFCLLTIVCVLFPILSFVLLTFIKKYPIDLSFSMSHIIRTFKMGGGRFLCNSLLISVGTAILGVIVAYITAYLTARTSGKSARFLHLVSITSLAIPGIVLGLSYILFFNGTWLYGTIIILVMVNTVHFFASPYLMIYNTLNKLNRNLESVGMTLGITKLQILRDVLIPQTLDTVVEMLMYFFVNCMMTISAVSFLSVEANRPLSLMINQFQSQMSLECASFVSLMIFIVNVILKGSSSFIKKKITGTRVMNAF